MLYYLLFIYNLYIYNAFLFLLCYTAFLFYPGILLLTRYQMEQMYATIVSVTNGNKEHIFILVIIIELFFSHWVLGFMYLVFDGVIVGVIVLIVVYNGIAKLQGIIL